MSRLVALLHFLTFACGIYHAISRANAYTSATPFENLTALVAVFFSPLHGAFFSTT
jgi:hypothetical protein